MGFSQTLGGGSAQGDSAAPSAMKELLGS
jgi:hypothetical protein